MTEYQLDHFRPWVGENYGASSQFGYLCCVLESRIISQRKRIPSIRAILVLLSLEKLGISENYSLQERDIA